jgi:hypothetical protein
MYSKIKSIKEVTKSRNPGFSNFFAWLWKDPDLGASKTYGSGYTYESERN